MGSSLIRLYLRWAFRLVRKTRKHIFHFFKFFQLLPAGHRRPASEIGKTCEQQLSADRALMKPILLDSVCVQNDQLSCFWSGDVSRSK